jgi:hypothetical protein
MVLKGDKNNPADIRANADDRATFGSLMTGPGGKFKPDFEGIGRMMSPGTLNQSGTTATGDKEFVASNPNFNPKSKQVFAALDYGRRPHGASTKYGKSMIVLSEKLKTNAIYFAGDTFFASDQAAQMAKMVPGGSMAKVSADHQISYDLLGALVAYAHPKLKQDLVTSCLKDMLLKDTSDAELLVEAHLFEPLLFRSGVDKMFVSLTKPDGSSFDAPTKAAIQRNAFEFCQRNGVALRFLK